jgi:hypothetical protein
MKYNSSLAGGGDDNNFAHKFYYHIPHPSVPYIDSNLKNYGKDSYDQYNQSYQQQQQVQPDPQLQSAQPYYASGTWNYPSNYVYTANTAQAPYPNYGYNYDYQNYNYNYNTQPETPQPQVTYSKF